MTENEKNHSLAQIHTSETLHQKLLRASETPGPLDYAPKQRTISEKKRGGHISRTSGLKFPASVAVLHKDKPGPASYRAESQKFRSGRGKFVSKEERFRDLNSYKKNINSNTKVQRSARGDYFIHTTPKRSSRSLSPGRKSETYVDTPIPKTARERIAQYKSMRRTPIQNRLFPGARKEKMVRTIGSAYKHQRSRSVPRRRKIKPSPIHHHYEDSTPASRAHQKHAHDRPKPEDMSDDELENRLGAEMGFHSTTYSDGVFMESLRSHPGNLTPDELGWKDQRMHSKFHQFHSKHGDGSMLMEAIHKLSSAAYGYGHGHSLRREFENIDKDHSGTLSYMEMKHALRKLCPLSDEEIQIIFDTFDENRDGVIDYKEFIKILKKPDWDHLSNQFQKESGRQRGRSRRKDTRGAHNRRHSWLGYSHRQAKKVLPKKRIGRVQGRSRIDSYFYAHNLEGVRRVARSESPTRRRASLQSQNRRMSRQTKISTPSKRAEKMTFSETPKQDPLFCETMQKLKKLTSSRSIENVIQLLSNMDENHNGRLSYKKMKQALQRLFGEHISASELRSIFNAFDLDCVGSVDYVEFARRLLMKNENDESQDSKTELWTEEERMRHLQRPTEAMELRQQIRERSAGSDSFHEKDSDAVLQNLAKSKISNFTPHQGAFVSSLRSQHEEGHHTAFGSRTSRNLSPKSHKKRDSLWMEEKVKNEKLFKRSLKKISKLIESVETEDSLRSMFRTFDRNRDQRISMQEFKASLSKVQLTDPESRALFKHYDQDSNGKISFAEFARGVESSVTELRKQREAEMKKKVEKRKKEDIQRQRPLTRQERVTNYLKNKFESLDGNSDGVLTDSELESLAMWAYHLTDVAAGGDSKSFEAFKSELLDVCQSRGKKKKQMDCKTFLEIFKPMFIQALDDEKNSISSSSSSSTRSGVGEGSGSSKAAVVSPEQGGDIEMPPPPPKD